MEYEDMIQTIRDYADEHPSFDTDFVDSVEAWASEHEVTENQLEALSNIISKFRMLK